MISLATGSSSTTDDTIVNYGRFSEHRVPHLRQNTEWDCGLACVAMTLQGLNIEGNLEKLTRQCAVNSIWTIDLAFLLRNYVKDFTYYTSYLGSRKEYQEAKFYQDNFDEDEKRVNKLFAAAKSCLVHVVRMILPMDDFKRFCHCEQFALITLVNAQLLRCRLCNQKHRNCLTSVCRHIDTMLERFKGNDYVGHFIVLIGYDQSEDAFIYRDPAVEDEYCVVSTKDLDRARQSEGTDHDCIIVKLC